MEKWIWIELIGFDKDSPDFAVGRLFANIGRAPDGVSLLISSCDFVNGHGPDSDERTLSPMCCSYEGHPCNEERRRQVWSGAELKGLIRTLQAHGTQVFLSFFNMFSYRDDDGCEVVEPFGAAHPELWECRRDGSSQKTLHMLKRFADGRLYEDFLATQLAAVLCDYGFDGVQLADGISSSRLTVQNGDYSDDIVGQFLQWGGLLPAEIIHAPYIERANYIFERCRLQWLNFLSDRWAQFYKKVLLAVKCAGKKVIFNSCWTRDPFEAYYRYGLDYQKLDISAADACMVEEVSACMSIYGEADQGGFPNSLHDRADWHYEFWAMQLMLKKTMPGLSLYNLSSLKDTNEQWDVIRDAPTEYAKAVFRDNSLALWQGGAFRPTLSGAFFCLADGLSSGEWKRIADLWDRAELVSGFVPQGILAVADGTALEKEVNLFLQTRAYPSHKMLACLLRLGVPIAGVAEPAEALTYNGARLLLYPEFYEPGVRERLLGDDSAPVFTLGCSQPTADADFMLEHAGERGCTYFAVYHAKMKVASQHFAYRGKKLPPDPIYEREGAIWTKKLTFAGYDRKFFPAVARVMTGEADLPVPVTESGHVTLSAVRTSEGKLRVYAENSAYFYALPRVDCRRIIKRARSLTKYAGFHVPVKGNEISLRIPNRGIEVVEIEYEDVSQQRS